LFDFRLLQQYRSKGDICRYSAEVRFGIGTGHPATGRARRLRAGYGHGAIIHHLIGGCEQRSRHGKAERFGYFRVEDKL
jgi:hypothetical protein